MDNDQAIGRTLDAIAAAWEKGDATAYAALFTPDVDYTAYDGTRMAGRQAVIDGHRALFAGIMRGSRMVFAQPHIRLLNNDVAIVAVQGGIIMRWQKHRQSPSSKRISALTLVLVRSDTGWLVTAFQNTRYRPWDKTLLGRVLTKVMPA